MQDSFAEVRALLRDARERLDGVSKPSVEARKAPLSGSSRPVPQQQQQQQHGPSLLNRLMAGERAYVPPKVNLFTVISGALFLC